MKNNKDEYRKSQFSLMLCALFLFSVFSVCNPHIQHTQNSPLFILHTFRSFTLCVYLLVFISSITKRQLPYLSLIVTAIAVTYLNAPYWAPKTNMGCGCIRGK
ncbi:hypothetical protein ACOSQ2_018340 [Xanthoceras sorbifolium]